MNKIPGRPNRSVVLALSTLCLLLLSGHAAAEIVTFSYEGTDGEGATVSGKFGYETDTPDINSNRYTALYLTGFLTGTISGGTADGVSFSLYLSGEQTEGNIITIVATNQFYSTFWMRERADVGEYELINLESTSTVFIDTSLPTQLNVADWDKFNILDIRRLTGSENLFEFTKITVSTPKPEGPVDLGGEVKTADGTGVCAMVLASGQYMFSCNPYGPYALNNLSREIDSSVKRQVYAHGFFPRADVLPGTTYENVVMERAGSCPNYNLPYNPDTFPGSAGKRHSISGRVLLQSTDMPICAMVLANGTHMFSCDGSGRYSLEFPLDNNGQFKLQVYADGFAPTVQSFDEFSLGGDVRMARSAECQAPPITDTVTFNGIVWAQADLFPNISANEMNAVCPRPEGLCSGFLNGYDVNGWMWASVEDISDLLVSLGGPPLTYPPTYHDGGTGSDWAPAFFDLGFRSNFESAGRAHIALTSTSDEDCNDSPPACGVEARIVDRADNTVRDFVELGAMWDRGVSRGVWLYKPQSSRP
jgi:hypothetical protein